MVVYYLLEERRLARDGLSMSCGGVRGEGVCQGRDVLSCKQGLQWALGSRSTFSDSLRGVSHMTMERLGLCIERLVVMNIDVVLYIERAAFILERIATDV